MTSLNDKKWVPFSLGNTDIFDLHSTFNGIDKNKLDISGERVFPYVTRTDNNNGISGFVPKQIKEINPGNTISIGLDTQTVFYQPTAYYTGQNIQILSYHQASIKTALFLIPLIRKQLENLNWGGNGATLSRLKVKKILLPVDSAGKPDWNFMEDFISEKKRNYNVPSPVTSGTKPICLKSKKWDTFSLGNIFTVSRGKRLVKSDQSIGTIPYISSTAQNNGVAALINTPSKKFRSFHNFIGVNNSGSVGEAFYHKYPAIVSDHVTALRNSMLNNYNAIFITTLVSRSLNEKFSFNHEISDSLMKIQKIMLPVDSAGKPDWNFMENYIKSLPNAELI